MSKKFDVNALPEIAKEMIEMIHAVFGQGDDADGAIGKYAVTKIENPGFYPAGIVVPIVAQEHGGEYVGFFKGIEGAYQGEADGDGALWTIGRLGEHFELAPEEVAA